MIFECGNGAFNIAEECDDSNIIDSDGCSSTCIEEVGWNCVNFPSICSPICGDGI